MGSVKYQEQILDAIDQLRRRKARPDADRIFNALSRRHGIHYAEAKAALERCIDTGVVLKVSYKGNISYRNATKKFPHLRRDVVEIAPEATSKGPPPLTQSRKFTALLTNAFAHLVIGEPDYLQLGVPKEELVRYIISKETVKYTKNYIGILLDKEVENGGLVKMANGQYLVGPARPRAEERASESRALEGKIKKKPGSKSGLKRERSIESRASEERRSDNGLSRVGGRRKVCALN